MKEANQVRENENENDKLRVNEELTNIMKALLSIREIEKQK